MKSIKNFVIGVYESDQALSALFGLLVGIILGCALSNSRTQALYDKVVITNNIPAINALIQPTITNNYPKVEVWTNMDGSFSVGWRIKL